MLNKSVVGRFEKVSFESFIKGLETSMKLSNDNYLWVELLNDSDKCREFYDSIKLPERATERSAGYDFYYPLPDIVLKPNTTIIFPTGIKANIFYDNWFLGVYTKSGLGFKNKIKMDDTVGIIDADYYDSDEEGNILITLTNEHPVRNCTIVNGQPVAQGVFQIYGVVEGDKVSTKRHSGFGHTFRQS